MAVTINETSWPQLQRLRFIERQLLWDREVTLSMLTGAFGILRPEALDSIKTYIELAPENVRPFEPSDRSYKPTASFKPKLIPDSADSLFTIARLAAPSNPDFYSVPVLNRSTAPGTLAAILTAIEHRVRFEAVYVSMQNPEGTRRSLTPSAIISASNRLHVRAYCWERQGFRDFVLNRFRTTPQLQMGEPDLLPQDSAWEETLEVRLIANPSLSTAQQALITDDYDLNQLEPFKIRKALITYFLQANLLPTSSAELDEAAQMPQRFPVLAVSAQSNESVVAFAF
ncbi:MAG: WYL domain-containing protein [Oceanospirillaceae bacterium]|nr:WYL domain-containing protein [Oceanospirillaceae bacterium]